MASEQCKAGCSSRREPPAHLHNALLHGLRAACWRGVQQAAHDAAQLGQRRLSCSCQRAVSLRLSLGQPTCQAEEQLQLAVQQLSAALPVETSSVH